MKKVLVFQMEDRTDDNLQAFMNENRYICSTNNIDYLFLQTSSFHVPPYWGKIFELHKVMVENPDMDYVMWLDSDAFFVNYDNEKLQRFLKTHETYLMIFTTDMPPIQKDAFNAGSFLVKNTEEGRRLVKKWMSHYHPENWEYTNEKWVTESVWAGEDYEQGAFVKHMINDPEYNKKIIQLSYKYLNNHNCEDNLDDVITTHLAAERKRDANTVQKCLLLFKTQNKNTVDVFGIKFTSQYFIFALCFAAILLIAILTFSVYRVFNAQVSTVSIASTFRKKRLMRKDVFPR